MQSLHGISSSSEAEELGGNRSGSPGVKGSFDEVIGGAAFFVLLSGGCKQYKPLFILLMRLNKTRKL